jgi:hypothetical protein
MQSGINMESDTLQPFSPETLADPYPAYRAMRERGSVQRTTGWRPGTRRSAGCLRTSVSAKPRAGAEGSGFRANDVKALTACLAA